MRRWIIFHKNSAGHTCWVLGSCCQSPLLSLSMCAFVAAALSVGLVRRQSPLLSEHVQQHCGLCPLATSVASVVACCNRSVSVSPSSVVGRPCGLVSCQSVGPISDVAVSHHCSWSMCAYVVASRERAVAPGCSMPVGPVLWWPVCARASS